ncbi:MAG: DUF6516 family protein [Dehalococcoidia bacterium]
MSEAKHGWNTLEDYLHVLQHVVDDDPFVISHSLSIDLSAEAGDISGDVLCHGDIILDVTKHFEILEYADQRYARTARYSYHARYEGGDDILRYDNAHADDTTGHSTTHHKHTFDGDSEMITDVREFDWPHLSEVLAELRGIVWR